MFTDKVSSSHNPGIAVRAHLRMNANTNNQQIRFSANTGVAFETTVFKCTNKQQMIGEILQ